MKRLPLVLSTTALIVAVFGSTPVGHAVGSAIPPFAKSAGYAKQAGNASALNGIKASKQPRAGMLCPSAPTGSPHVCVGLVGPAGPRVEGRQGDKGSRPARSARRGDRSAGPRGAPAARGRSGSVAGRTSRRVRVPLGRVLQDGECRLPAGEEGVRRRCRRDLGLWAMRVIQSAPSGAAATSWARDRRERRVELHDIVLRLGDLRKRE